MTESEKPAETDPIGGIEGKVVAQFETEIGTVYHVEAITADGHKYIRAVPGPDVKPTIIKLGQD